MLRWKNRVYLLAVVFLFSSGTIPPTELVASSRASFLKVLEPAPLTVEEENSPAALALAKQFNPAMAFPSKDIWPTNVSYALHDRPNIMARVVAKTGKEIGKHIAVASEALQNNAWAGLPENTENGDTIEYFVDTPGDDRKTDGLPSWVTRWREIMFQDGVTEITETAYPPTQYAHLFWYNRAKGLLAVQYWFYYPYNNWVNRHEGDWEHINVILQGPSTLTPDAKFEPVGYQFFFHGSVYEPRQVIQANCQRGDGNHVVVFTGGSGKLLFWEGNFSGGSYPYPAYYPKAGHFGGPMAPGDDTRHPQRFIDANEFDVVLLPEPERVDVKKRPDIAWLRLPVFLGQNKVFGNPFPIEWLGRGGPPQQPGRKKDWNARVPSVPWDEELKLQKAPLKVPEHWQGRIVATALSPDYDKAVAEKTVRRRGALSAQRYLPADWH